MCRSSHEQSYSTLSPVSTGMGDRLLPDIPPAYVTKPTRRTQSYIPTGSLNRVPALIGRAALPGGRYITLCDRV